MLNPTTRPTMLHQREIDLETLYDQTPDTTTFGASYPAYIAIQLKTRPPYYGFTRYHAGDMLSKTQSGIGI